MSKATLHHTKSFKLSTGHLIHVVMPADEAFESPAQLRVAMLEAGIQLRRLAEAIETEALKP